MDDQRGKRRPGRRLRGATSGCALRRGSNRNRAKIEAGSDASARCKTHSGIVRRRMLPADVEGDPKKRTPADNATVRNVYVVGPDKKIKLILVYPMTTGRNFDEVLRVIDSLQLTAKHQVATPVNWKPGDDVIIAGSVSDEEAKKRYPQGWKAPKPYLRIVPQPQ